MKFHAIDNPAYTCGLRDAIMAATTSQGQLLLPREMPRLPRALFNNLAEMSLQELGYVVLNTLFGNTIDSASIKYIAEEALNFSMPLVEVDETTWALEMFHGPTMSHKDIAARLLARLISIYKQREAGTLHIVTATTGNAGAAMAAGFSKLPGVMVHVLYPKGSLTPLQESMITSQGSNIRAVEVMGSIDACRRLAMEALADEDLRKQMHITSAGSVNVGRVLTQTIAFFQAYASMQQCGIDAENMPISIPCGNMGNLMAALVAKRMGLPLGPIVAACNANNYLHRYLTECAGYGTEPQTKPTVRTLSRSMDTAVPSNFQRYVDIRRRHPEIARIDSHTVSDELTAQTINEVYVRSSYMLDPHSAVAYAALHATYPAGLILATAHPARSLDTMTAVTGRAMELPLQMTQYMRRRRADATLPPTYPALRKYLQTSNAKH